MIAVARRPYILSTDGCDFPASTDEVESLLGAYPVVRMAPNRLELRGADDTRLVVRPATLGGGPAFARGAS